MLDTMQERDGPEKRMCTYADSYRCGRHCTLPQTVWVEAAQCVTVRILTAFLANSTGYGMDVPSCAFRSYIRCQNSDSDTLCCFNPNCW